MEQQDVRAGWRSLLKREWIPTLAILLGGVLLQSMNVLMLTTVLPSIVLTVTLPETEPAIADIKVYAFRVTHDKTWTNDDDSGIFCHGWQHEPEGQALSITIGTAPTRPAIPAA